VSAHEPLEPEPRAAAGRLAGKVALITGAARGQGAAAVRRFVAEGARVLAADIADEAGKALAEQLGDAVRYTHLDVGSEDDWAAAITEVTDAFGRLDVLVNNAGVYEFAPIEQVTPEHFHKLFDLNVLGLLLTTQEALKHLGAGGSIVNISSVAATSAPPTTSVYSATKAAVDAVTRSLAKELGPRQVRVNSINPGMVETEGFHAAGIAESDFRRQIEAQTPLGRIGQPDDIGPAVVFLASGESAWITGETLHISGGHR
jgi:3-oxoacyl-[acyl-carrier protein] reductase